MDFSECYELSLKFQFDVWFNIKLKIWSQFEGCPFTRERIMQICPVHQKNWNCFNIFQTKSPPNFHHTILKKISQILKCNVISSEFFAAQSLFVRDIFAVSKYLLPVERTLPPTTKWAKLFRKLEYFSRTIFGNIFLVQFSQFSPQEGNNAV